MNKAQWKRKIKKACTEAGTYRKHFDEVINILAGVMERRDNAQEMFERSGGSVLVKHTNKAGATNIEQNPALRLINDLEKNALAYWRDLGLTPAGLKKINEQAMKGEKKQDKLSQVLSELGDLNG